MKTLSFDILPTLRENKNIQVPGEHVLELPEKVLQFGTGVLLRGLPDFLIDNANRQGLFNGRVVMVKSTDGGDLNAFTQQNNLYTICVRGVENGEIVEENVICSAISRVLSAKSHWQEVLNCAKNPDLQIVISNTTEVGIELVEESIRQEPPKSFPGKLLAFLYARYQAFAGHPNKGLVIVPTELIPNNGDELQAILLELAHLNNLEPEFIDWLENSNHCCNSLVDRIVPGTPPPTMQQELQEQLGYKDELAIMSESYYLWAIQGDERIKAVLNFHQVNPGIYIEPNIDRFRELKLRMLNGTHTLTCGLAFLAGFKTVKEGMKDAVLSAFVEHLMLSEIARGIPYSMPMDEIQRFGNQVLDRFRNPYLDHKWLSITLQYTSKMNMRNVPTLLNFVKIQHEAPEYMALGFAAYLLFMRAVKFEHNVYHGFAHGDFYAIQDPQAVYFYNLWQENSPKQLVQIVLSNQSFWGEDLSKLTDFAEQVTAFLIQMLETSVKETLVAMLQTSNLNTRTL
ncbi:MAG: tagaturonate reductase [Saprospiraceae bacterium]|nr:tagaturonate reductase [Saprospiraceae bacterium]